MSAGKVSWGKIITGAALAAGAVAAAAFVLDQPEMISKIGAGVRSFLGGAHEIVGDVGSWIIKQAGNLAALIAGNKEIAIGSAAAAGGLIAAASHHGKHKERDAEEVSFAEREDIRRMQALMVARMQAQGYQPAMAMNTQGRG